MLFNDSILVSGTRGSRRITFDVPACAIDDGVDSPMLNDGLTASDCDLATFFVRESDWPDPSNPQIGDVVRFDGRSFSVRRVSRLADCFNISTRSSK